jgi:hypothetical protein
MSIESVRSGHWTDDQLIEHMYGVGPDDGHAAACPDCRVRLSKLEARRAALNAGSDNEISHQFLAAQRRRIYSRMAQPVGMWKAIQIRRWASALATGTLLGAGLLYYQNVHQQAELKNQLSDAQLAQDVSSMAEDREPSPTAPLQALFEE